MMSLRSDNVTRGAERAPNRSLFYAMGYTKEELERPLIGVVSAHSEIVPGHFHLDKIADAVKAGVRLAGGTPILIPAIGVRLLPTLLLQKQRLLPSKLRLLKAQHCTLLLLPKILTTDGSVGAQTVSSVVLQANGLQFVSL